MNKQKMVRLLLLVFCIIVFGQISCIDPYEYEPDFPDLLDPPQPPELLYPPTNSIFDFGVPCSVVLEWQQVVGAETYDLEISIDTLVLDEIHNILECSCSYTAQEFGTYSWRVRADSRDWKWYTEWSDARTFVVRSPALTEFNTNDTLNR
jgi:hypothetical protein